MQAQAAYEKMQEDAVQPNARFYTGAAWTSARLRVGVGLPFRACTVAARARGGIGFGMGCHPAPQPGGRLRANAGAPTSRKRLCFAHTQARAV